MEVEVKKRMFYDYLVYDYTTYNIEVRIKHLKVTILSFLCPEETLKGLFRLPVHWITHQSPVNLVIEFKFWKNVIVLLITI